MSNDTKQFLNVLLADLGRRIYAAEGHSADDIAALKMVEDGIEGAIDLLETGQISAVKVFADRAGESVRIMPTIEVTFDTSAIDIEPFRLQANGIGEREEEAIKWHLRKVFADKALTITSEPTMDARELARGFVTMFDWRGNHVVANFHAWTIDERA